MSDPMMPRRAAMPLEDMLAGTHDVLDIEKLIEKMAPAQVGHSFRPSEDLMKVIYLLFGTAEGKQIFEWLMDLTLRAPYPHIDGSGFEQAAIAAAKHQARAGIGEVILEAVANGKRLLEQAQNRS